MHKHYDFSGFMGRRVHLGVCGSIAAYKSLDLLRDLQRADLTVSCTVTEGAARFVTPLSFEALGADPVYTSIFPDVASGESSFGHLEPGEMAQVLVIAPASATTIARLAHGLADDILSCQALAFPGPKIIAPAMNPRMWAAPATRRNWEILGEYGWTRINPCSGRVACGDEGDGKFPPTDTIFLEVLKALSPQDLAGQKVLITLGPTREPWDAVRFWSNPSSGLMGACLAVAAWLRGAEVTVVSGPVNLEFPAGINVIRVTTAREMFAASTELWPSMDIGCCTAAVADFHPIPHDVATKYKKGGSDSLTVEFGTNPDVLRTLGANKREHQRLIGFAAETGDPRAEAKRKLETKNLDLIAANRIDRPDSGFATGTNTMLVLDNTGRVEQWPNLKKTEVAWRLWDQLLLASA